jgi:hypothetical protein
MSPPVLIACREHLAALHNGDLRDALAFSGDDTLAALDVIKHQRPSLIVVEDLYAMTSRGRALIARIEADPTLGDCRIRIVPAVAGTAAAALKSTDRRRAPRFKVSNGVEVRFDGRRVSLVDLSLGGAQVICASSLRPNQRGKVTLSDTADKRPVPCGLAWVSLELVGGIPRYRAGIEFSHPDMVAVQGFIEATKKENAPRTFGVRLG